MKNVIGMSDPNVMFKGPGSLCMKSEIWSAIWESELQQFTYGLPKQ